MLKKNPKIIAKKLLSITLIISILLTTSGCWDSKDISQRSISTAIVVDKKNDNYIFYMERANLQAASASGQGGGGSNLPKYLITKGAGNSFDAALYQVERQLNQPRYDGAVEVLVLTENFAKDGILEFIYKLRANYEFRKKVTMVVTSVDPDKLFESTSENGQSIGTYYDNLLLCLKNNGETFYRPTSRLMENISSKYCSFIVPKIGIMGKTPILEGYCVFDNNYKCIGMIQAKYSKGMCLLKADNPVIRYTIPYNNVFFSITLKGKNKKFKANYKNKKISFDINLKCEGELDSQSKKCSVSDDILKKLTKELQMTLETEIKDAIKDSQKKYKCDYLGFDDDFHIAYPDVYHKLNWEIEYPKIKTNVNVTVKLEVEKGLDYRTRNLE